MNLHSLNFSIFHLGFCDDFTLFICKLPKAQFVNTIYESFFHLEYCYLIQNSLKHAGLKTQEYDMVMNFLA
jgi:hypothetical protein